MPELIHSHSLFSTGVWIHRCLEHSHHPRLLCGFFWHHQRAVPLYIGPYASFWWESWAGPGPEGSWEAGDGILHPSRLINTYDVHVFQRSWDYRWRSCCQTWGLIFVLNMRALGPWCQDFHGALAVDFPTFALGSSVQVPQEVCHVQLLRLKPRGFQAHGGFLQNILLSCYFHAYFSPTTQCWDLITSVPRTWLRLSHRYCHQSHGANHTGGLNSPGAVWKQQNETEEMNFTSTFSLTQSIQNIYHLNI